MSMVARSISSNATRPLKAGSFRSASAALARFATGLAGALSQLDSQSACARSISASLMMLSLMH
jgi:hypothetical protein